MVLAKNPPFNRIGLMYGRNISFDAGLSETSGNVWTEQQ
jgi:hypothetical protein